MSHKYLLVKNCYGKKNELYTFILRGKKQNCFGSFLGNLRFGNVVKLVFRFNIFSLSNMWSLLSSLLKCFLWKLILWDLAAKMCWTKHFQKLGWCIHHDLHIINILLKHLWKQLAPTVNNTDAWVFWATLTGHCFLLAGNIFKSAFNASPVATFHSFVDIWFVKLGMPPCSPWLKQHSASVQFSRGIEIPDFVSLEA